MRMMKTLAIALVALLLFSTGFPLVAGATYEGDEANGIRNGGILLQESADRRVVLILAPFLRWEDVTEQNTPRLAEATRTGAIGDINARSRVKEVDGNPSPIEGALTISSGAWPYVDEAAYSAFEENELFGYTKVNTAYKRFLSGNLEENKIAYLGLPRTVLANEHNSFTVIPGTLGSAIEAAGGSTAAIGNSDLGYSATDAKRVLRPAAIAAMNEAGFVRYGLVSEKILKENPEAAYGVQTDLDTVEKALKDVKKEMSAEQPGLIVLDPGDGYRARTAAGEVAPQVAEDQWVYSLTVLDGIYAQALAAFPDATIIVASQASRSLVLNREGFGPLIITSPEVYPGLIESDSTQRLGLVTNLDLSATILALAGVQRPVQVLGSEIYVLDPADIPYAEGVDLADLSETTQKAAAANRDARLDLLNKMNNTALSVESVKPVVTNTTIWLSVVVLLFGALVITLADKYWQPLTVKTLKAIFYLSILGVLSSPAASWLMFLINRWPATPAQVTLQFLGVEAALWAAALLIWRLAKSPRLPLIFLSATTSAIIIIDQFAGAPWSFTSFFGYSPIAAFRFYGIGNEGAAILVGAVITGITLALDEWSDTKAARHLRLWGSPLIGALTVIVCAAPGLGANVGVAIWATVGFIVLWMLTNNKRITWKSIIAMGLTVVVVLAALIALDRYGSGAQTHLARSIGSAEQGGLIELWQIAARKIQTNLRVFVHSNLTYLFAALIIYIAYMRWRPRRDFAAMLTTNPAFGDGITATLIAGIVAYCSEDSGIVLPALMVVYLGAAMVWLMLIPLKGRASASPPATDPSTSADGCGQPSLQTTPPTPLPVGDAPLRVPPTETTSHSRHSGKTAESAFPTETTSHSRHSGKTAESAFPTESTSHPRHSGLDPESIFPAEHD